MVVDLREFNTLCFGGMGLASSVSMVLAGRISELARQPEQLTLLRRMLAGIFGLRGRETHLCKYVAMQCALSRGDTSPYRWDSHTIRGSDRTRLGGFAKQRGDTEALHCGSAQ